MFNTRPWLYYDSQYTNKFTNTYIQGILDICGNIIVRNGGFSLPGGDVSMNGNLYVGQQTTLIGDVSMNGNIWVGKQTTLVGDVSMNGNLYVGLDASFNRDVSIKGISTFNNDIYQIDGSYNINISSVIGTFPNYGTTNIGSNLINVGSNNYKLVANLLRDSIAIGNTILNGGNPNGYGIIGIGKNVFPQQFTTGFQNIGIGNAIATSMTIGHNNVFIGNGVATNSSSTGNTVAIGTYAGSTNTTGINNTFIGAYTDANAGNYNNSTAIGYGTTITKSNQIKLGTSSETVDISGGDLNIYGNINVSGNTSVYNIIPTLIGYSGIQGGSSSATFGSTAAIPINNGSYYTGNPGYPGFYSAANFATTDYFTATQSGYYYFHSVFNVQTFTTGYNGVIAKYNSNGVYANGTTIASTTVYSPNESMTQNVSFSFIISMAAGDNVVYYAIGANTRTTIESGTNGSSRCNSVVYLLQIG
jgi:hypothetical protein